ncbi:HAMP domain-containing sensor histidine kinase [Nannocystis sp.]|uniref:sensor histidine kinase n=1 Tax=Nannocystis sp. TaxID=1962667 RepID=UPI0025E9C194|nr:HAMP domain-containing sensor histidine kinase [Nannocystis sp.]MBK7828678.1 HAMP domain-containing histidine kinase [Nannocystis sp.]
MKAERTLSPGRRGERRQVGPGDPRLVPDAAPRLVQVEAIDRLIAFGHGLTGVSDAAAIVGLLARALVSHVAADAVAVLLRDGGGAPLVLTPGLPQQLRDLPAVVQAQPDGLASALLAACEGRFAAAAVRPLTAGGEPLGWVVSLFRGEAPLGPRPLFDGMLERAAAALAAAACQRELARAQAQIEASRAKFAKVDKLLVLGEMTAGISHDLRNILNPISLHLQLISRAADRGQLDNVKRSVVEIQGVLARGLQTLDRLRAYARHAPESRFEPVDLNRLAHEGREIALPHMASRSGRTDYIDEEFGASAPVLGRAGDIISAVVNLLVNAIEATPDGGAIKVRTGATPESSWIEVIDDGPGMPPEVAARVFEPFYTTKGEQGTGLGLAMVASCMQRHQGSVTVDTAPGKGTRFRLSFPPLAG